ncbi:MAG: hypothetical protein HZA48_12960 [Planctomycetes bacterium]|nr:hypothetical protein [Planctomycetota bacterium]
MGFKGYEVKGLESYVSTSAYFACLRGLSSEAIAKEEAASAKAGAEVYKL